MRRTTGFLLAGLFVALLLAGVVSNVASAAPDGLDAASYRGCTRDAAGQITDGTCIAQGAQDHEVAGSPLADYSVGGSGGALSTGLSGVIGVLVTFAVAGGLFWVIRSRHRAGAERAPSGRRAGAERAPTQ